MKHESRGKVRAKWPWRLGLAALSIPAIGLNAEGKAAEIDDGYEFRD